MKILGIDFKKCTGCGECVRDCPPGLFSQPGGQAPAVYSDPLQRCIACGHCIAVCPPGAVLYAAEEEAFTCSHINEPGELVRPAALFDFLALRRSIRRFKKQSVAPGDLEAVLRAMQYAPSASNARKWQYLIITDPVLRDYLSAQTVGMFKIVNTLIRFRWLLKPFIPRYLKRLLFSPTTHEAISKALSDFKAGKDIVFFHAPCVIILHAPAYGKMTGNDAGIALTYGMLTAQARGLGSCWIGFAEEALLRNRKLARSLAIPKGHHVYGVLALGYPAVRYYRVPPREKVKVGYR